MAVSPEGSQTSPWFSNKYYKVNLTVDKAPNYQMRAENVTVDTTITHSWDNKYMCVDCKGPNRHSIHKKGYFPLILSNQHMDAKVPALDGHCIATCKFENLTIGQIIDNYFYMVASAAMKDEKPRSNDEFGAVHAIQKAIDLGRDMHLFFLTGTGPIFEQAAGTSNQMQRALDLISCSKPGAGKAGKN